MTSETRCVFDANVAISALLFEHSKPGQAFRLALDHHIILISLPVLTELIEVLGRKKFERYILPQERDRFIEALVREAQLIEITEEIQVCRDPKDDKYLELAVNGVATCLVSGDDDLLALHPFRGISIITPDEFLRQFAS